MKKYILSMLMGTIIVSGAALATENVVSAQTVPAEIAEKVQDFKAKRAEARKEMKENFAKKLGLTEEQQEKASAIHQKSKAEMEDIKKQMKDLRQKADTIRENNKKEFALPLFFERGHLPLFFYYFGIFERFEGH